MRDFFWVLSVYQQLQVTVFDPGTYFLTYYLQDYITKVLSNFLFLPICGEGLLAAYTHSTFRRCACFSMRYEIIISRKKETSKIKKTLCLFLHTDLEEEQWHILLLEASRLSTCSPMWPPVCLVVLLCSVKVRMCDFFYRSF